MNRRTFIRLAAGVVCLAATDFARGEERRPGIQDRGAIPTRERPLVLDRELRAVRIYTEIDEKTFLRTNPHWGVVFKDGKFADKGIVKAFCSPVEFHDALVHIGARPGNDLTEESTGHVSRGDRLIVTAAIMGDEGLPLGRVFRDSSGKGFSIRFGGNRRAAEEANTGCITCLESCWVGITSNAAYPLIGTFKRFVSPNSLFSGNPDLLVSTKNRSLILTYKLA